MKVNETSKSNALIFHVAFQMIEDEDDRDFSPLGDMAPRFDRSFKPKPAPPTHAPSSIRSSSRQVVSSQQEAEWERNMARLRDFQGIESSSRRCLTGLKNLGNTCYMNSILQVKKNNRNLRGPILETPSSHSIIK